MKIVLTTASYTIDKTSGQVSSSAPPDSQVTEPTLYVSTPKPIQTSTYSFENIKDSDFSNESRGKRKILRKRIVKKLVPRRKFRSGKARRRKRFRPNKYPDRTELKFPPIETELEGHFPLHTVKKDINIYNSYGNRAVYYKIYNGKLS